MLYAGGEGPGPEAVVQLEAAPAPRHDHLDIVDSVDISSVTDIYVSMRCTSESSTEFPEKRERWKTVRLPPYAVSLLPGDENMIQFTVLALI